MFKLEGKTKEMVEKRLRKEGVIWLTTTNSAGQAVPTPVWFLWESGDKLLIYSQEDTHKVRNIRLNPRVSLNFNCDEWGGNVIVLTGTAAIDTSAPLAHENPAYVEKYREGIKDINMTPESMGISYHIPIVVTIKKIRAWE